MHCLDGCLMISTVVGYVSSTFEGGRMGDNLEFFGDRKSTRLNSSHLGISYAVFCLKKKKKGLNGSVGSISRGSLCLDRKTKQQKCMVFHSLQSLQPLCTTIRFDIRVHTSIRSSLY